MRARFGWVGVAVVLSSGVGVVAALAASPTPRSSPTTIERTANPAPTRDLVTPQVRALASEAQQLGQEITSAQGELTYLEHEVAYEATLSHYRLSPPAPTLRVASTTAVRSHDEVSGASATRGTEGEGAVTSTSVATPSTTEVTTTVPTTSVAPTTAPCATSYEDPSSSGASCPTGVSYDN